MTTRYADIEDSEMGKLADSFILSIGNYGYILGKAYHARIR
ncbi:hypothetical protein ABS765_06460 [Chryseobacterium sp. ST-37]|uniref:Uncharacterized protein n=1 Tax=Chryseobacterium terrae TaxID=3163299 RepID=A0ABW8Y1H2_9FLAO